MDEPPTKRQRTTATEVPPAHVDDALPQLGFQLTRLKDAPAAHNTYAVGLADLLGGDFRRVLLTNYMYDLAWLFSECPRLADVPVVLVHGERDREAMQRECRGFTNVTAVAPRLPIAYGTHHTKMMVVLYATKVRVAIFTANFIPIDWNNKTQGVWFQDFELATIGEDDDDDDQGDARCTSSVVDFKRDLVDYLSTLGAPVVAFCKELDRFDFSTATVALSHVRFSSLGSLDEKWLFGEFAESLMPRPNPSSATMPIKSLHIRNSIEGWNAGRAVPCPLKNMKPFLHKYLRKWTPPAVLHRQNAMPHIKTYARFDPSQTGAVDWALLSSSNLSKAAWGALQKNGSQLMIRSYELGVLFLPQLCPDSPTQYRIVGSADNTPPASSSTNPSSCEQTVYLPLPYGFPIKTYDPTRDEPWVWDLVREDPDVYGHCYIPR
ncbi:hypothetical protein ATCC90586_008237 [Pythium insidiosum]|nr:hypothetical protein ATCC90586_008237 [Pythium insidiosum]